MANKFELPKTVTCSVHGDHEVGSYSAKTLPTEIMEPKLERAVTVDDLIANAFCRQAADAIDQQLKKRGRYRTFDLHHQVKHVAKQQRERERKKEAAKAEQAREGETREKASSFLANFVDDLDTADTPATEADKPKAQQRADTPRKPDKSKGKVATTRRPNQLPKTERGLRKRAAREGITVEELKAQFAAAEEAETAEKKKAKPTRVETGNDSPVTEANDETSTATPTPATTETPVEAAATA